MRARAICLESKCIGQLLLDIEQDIVERIGDRISILELCSNKEEGSSIRKLALLKKECRIRFLILAELGGKGER